MLAETVWTCGRSLCPSPAGHGICGVTGLFGHSYLPGAAHAPPGALARGTYLTGESSVAALGPFLALFGFLGEEEGGQEPKVRARVRKTARATQATDCAAAPARYINMPPDPPTRPPSTTPFVSCCCSIP